MGAAAPVEEPGRRPDDDTTVTATPDEAIDAPNGRRPIAVQPLQFAGLAAAVTLTIFGAAPL
jgi:hypothetical protein